MGEVQTLEKKARELIASQNTMALATAKSGQPWAAPVYYVFCRGEFYFFSAPDSRHILEAAESGQAAATIYPAVSSSWQDIQGIQMAGEIKKGGLGLGAIQALKAYIEKYPFVREFFAPRQELNLEDFTKRFRVRFYRFQPASVYYTDNTIRFGFREPITLK